MTKISVMEEYFSDDSTIQYLNDLDEQRIKLNRKRKNTIPILVFIPIIALIVANLLKAPIPLLFWITAVASIISGMIYQGVIKAPFNRIKENLKQALLGKFMEQYHPLVKYAYGMKSGRGGGIVRKSDLIGFDKCKEEDVISGFYQDQHFYLSEINLLEKNDDHETSVFKGLLFKIKFNDRTFPKSQIRTEYSFFQNLFDKKEKNEEFGFWYETESNEAFNHNLASLFPFIQHLKNKNKDIRISVQGDELILLIESKMKFLDEPKPKLSNSFSDKNYFNNLGKQVNSLFFILDSFINNLDKTEIEKTLELKHIDWLEQEMPKLKRKA